MLMFNQIGDYEKGQSSDVKNSQLVKFNLDFERYADDKGIKGTDIISLINKIIDYNTRASNGGINNDVNYDVKMSVTISGLNKFNDKYAYNDISYKLFKQDLYIFGAGGESNNKIKEELNSYSAAEAGIGINNLKKLASAYDTSYNENVNKKNIKEILIEIDQDTYKNWPNDPKTPTIDTIRKYKQYSEFKTSTFKVSKDSEYEQGQIKNLYFEFSK